VNVVNGNEYLDVVICAETGEVVSKKEMGATRSKPFAITISSSGSDAPAINYFAAPKLLQKASELTGKEVKNPQGEKLGKLEELTIDPYSGRILYGVLSFGGLLGIGDKLFAIPWPSLHLNPGTDHFVLSVTKDRLKLAEGFDKSAWPNMADQRWATQTHAYYGQEPYWTVQTTRITTTEEGNSPNEIRTREEYRRRWFAPTTGWVKAHDLMGKNAKTAATSEPIGELHELMIDPDAGRVVYGILKFDGKYFAIPWMGWSNEPGFDYAVLNVTKDRLKLASSFENNAWPNLADLRRAREIHGFYGYPVYWEDEDDIVITKP
jgi:sporulation protein YlmC with PRC-barrel domain